MAKDNKIVSRGIVGSLIVAAGIIGAFLWIRHQREKKTLLIQHVLEQAGDSDWNRNPPYMAALCGDVPHLKEMLDAEPDILNQPVGFSQSTLLHAAVMRGNTAAVELLLSRGAEVNPRNRSGHTPLYDCVADNGNGAIALMLLEHGADLSLPDNNGKTPLQIAVQKQRLEMAALLQQHGAK